MLLDGHLVPQEANSRPLTPVDFPERALSACQERAGVVWRDRSRSHGAFGGMAVRRADWLEAHGIRKGGVVSVMCPNRPAMLAAHYAVPMLGAVLNSVNTRLDQETVAHFKVPRRFEFRELSRTATGKAQKFVRKEAAHTLAQAEEAGQ
jgi:fatty-acyl-CoA synthase